MLPSEFVRRLLLVDPEDDSGELALARREYPLTYDGPTNEIVELICNWDVTLLDIASITFLPDGPIEMEHGLHIGYDEVDPLLILDETGEIYVADFNEPTHLMAAAAKTPGNFLAALVSVAEHMEVLGAAEHATDCRDLEASRAAAEHCAWLAGGEKYYGFYESVFTAFE